MDHEAEPAAEKNDQKAFEKQDMEGNKLHCGGAGEHAVDEPTYVEIAASADTSSEAGTLIEQPVSTVDDLMKESIKGDQHAFSDCLASYEENTQLSDCLASFEENTDQEESSATQVADESGKQDNHNSDDSLSNSHMVESHNPVMEMEPELFVEATDEFLPMDGYKASDVAGCKDMISDGVTCEEEESGFGNEDFKTSGSDSGAVSKEPTAIEVEHNKDSFPSQRENDSSISQGLSSVLGTDDEVQKDETIRSKTQVEAIKGACLKVAIESNQAANGAQANSSTESKIDSSISNGLLKTPEETKNVEPAGDLSEFVIRQETCDSDLKNAPEQESFTATKVALNKLQDTVVETISEEDVVVLDSVEVFEVVHGDNNIVEEECTTVVDEECLLAAELTFAVDASIICSSPLPSSEATGSPVQQAGFIGDEGLDPKCSIETKNRRSSDRTEVNPCAQTGNEAPSSEGKLQHGYSVDKDGGSSMDSTAGSGWKLQGTDGQIATEDANSSGGEDSASSPACIHPSSQQRKKINIHHQFVREIVKIQHDREQYDRGQVERQIQAQQAGGLAQLGGKGSDTKEHKSNLVEKRQFKTDSAKNFIRRGLNDHGPDRHMESQQKHATRNKKALLPQAKNGSPQFRNDPHDRNEQGRPPFPQGENSSGEKEHGKNSRGKQQRSMSIYCPPAVARDFHAAGSHGQNNMEESGFPYHQAAAHAMNSSPDSSTSLISEPHFRFVGSPNLVKDEGTLKVVRNTSGERYVRYIESQAEQTTPGMGIKVTFDTQKKLRHIEFSDESGNIGHKQLKVWFQNRRCRDKQRKEMSRLQSWNSKLNAMNQLLLEENERLQKQAAQLSSENQYLRQQLQLQQPNVDLNPRMANPVIMATTDTSSESVVTSGQHQHSPQHPSQEWSLSQLSAIAEKTLAEFLAKATGSVVDGIPLPGMKPGPDSSGAFALTRLCGGVAAQACCLIDLEPFKVAEIVKNRPLWLQDCRRLDILASFTADRGGLAELVHTQMYAPTTLDAPRDFWTLRYTCCMEDGSLVICERSLVAGQGVQEIPITPGFVRAEMLPSGILIRPYEQGGSMVMVVDDMNFKSGSFLEGLRPLYDTSTILARRVTHKVLCHLRSVVKEKAEVSLISDPSSSLRGFSHRLIRGFNDAVNCFPDEGWVSIINDGPSTVSVHINPPSNCKQFGVTEAGSRIRGGIICAKASLLLHSVPPPLLLRFLRERWIAWADFGTDISQVDSRKTSVNDSSKKKFSSVQVLQPIAGQDEVLEVVRVQRSRSSRGDDIFQSDNFLLQLCSGMEEIEASEYAQLIFAPIDASVPDDAPLLPSGFRVMHLGGCKEKSASSQTLDLASSLEDRSTNNRMQMSGSHHSMQEQSSILTIAFQYMYKAESRDVVALNAQRHVQALVDILQQAAISLRLHLPSAMTAQYGVEYLVLVQQIADSYRSYLGQELLACTAGSAEGMLKSFWSLKDSIVCCAWKPLPEFIFANQAALEMLETNSTALRELSLEQMFNDGCRKTDYSQPPPFIQKEGYACLPSGVCLTSTGRPVSFERAMGWKVITNDQNMQVAAFMFCNWSFASVPLQ